VSSRAKKIEFYEDYKSMLMAIYYGDNFENTKRSNIILSELIVKNQNTCEKTR
jgi:hypothetical protein